MIRGNAVAEARRFETPHGLPQPPLWSWGEDERLRVLPLPAYARRRETRRQAN